MRVRVRIYKKFVSVLLPNTCEKTSIVNQSEIWVQAPIGKFVQGISETKFLFDETIICYSYLVTVGETYRTS